MPIAQYKPTASQPTQGTPVKIQEDSYKGIVVDSKYQDLNGLVAFIEGYPLTVDYYGQILGQDNDVREIDPAQSNVYQQYLKIRRLQVRVEQPLNLSYNDESGLSTVTGSANMIPNIIPNTFDYFTFTTTRGRIGLFRITNVERKSMNRDSVYHIEYNLIGYIDESDAKILYNSLENKVRLTKYFHIDRLIEGKDPILLDQEHQSVIDLEEYYEKILNYYINGFFNREFQTLVIPGQTTSIYDKFVMDFLLKIISVEENELAPYIKQLGSDRDRFMEQPQFWTAIIDREPLFIEQANKFMGITNRRNFISTHYVSGAAFSTAIEKFVYPINPDESSILPYDPVPKLTDLGLVDTFAANSSFYTNTRNIYAQPTGDSLLYKRVLSDPYYVLSKDFYTDKADLCLLEKVTWDYLNDDEIDSDELIALVKAFFYLARLEQFYFGPLLMILIKTALSQESS